MNQMQEYFIERYIVKHSDRYTNKCDHKISRIEMEIQPEAKLYCFLFSDLIRQKCY